MSIVRVDMGAVDSTCYNRAMKMYRLGLLRCTLAIGASLLWPASVAQGATVQNLYSATVPIAAQSEAERRKAVRQGLADVLVKMSGTRAVLNNVAVRAALTQSESYMLEFGYATQVGADGSPRNALTVRYAAPLVDQLLREQQLPIWPANRPEWVVWVVLDRPAGLQFVAADGDGNLYAQLEQAFSRRGLGYQLPLLDLQDQLTLSTEQAWNFDAAALHAAARRYAAEYGFVVRYGRTSSGWEGGWLVAGAGTGESGTVSAQSIDALLVAAVDAAVDRFAPRFAYAGGGSQTKASLTLENITSYQIYADALALVKTLEMVSNVQVTQVEGDLLHLSVNVEGDAQILLAALQRDTALTLVTPTASMSSAQPTPYSYRFRWRGVTR